MLSPASSVTSTVATGQDSVTIEQYKAYETLDPAISLDADGNPTSLRIRRTGGEGFSGEDWAVIEMRFSNGKQATYFVDMH